MAEEVICARTQLDDEFGYVFGLGGILCGVVERQHFLDFPRIERDNERECYRFKDFIKDPEYMRPKLLKSAFENKKIEEQSVYEAGVETLGQVIECSNKDEEDWQESDSSHERDKDGETTGMHEIDNSGSQFGGGGDDRLRKSKKIAKESKQKKRRSPYPTKNFLQTFKPWFLNYLADTLGQERYRTHPVVSKIASKTGINLNDYQDLFNVNQFRPFFLSYFGRKVHYRQLMMSRIASDLKQVYYEKIQVFQEAFLRGSFTHINEVAGYRVTKMT